jgi:flagellar assembly factor FliW
VTCFAGPVSDSTTGGTVAADPDGREVTLVHALPGLPGLTRYRLRALEETGVLFTLESDDTDVSLLVAAPWAFFPDYAPVLSDEDVDLLGLTRAEDALLFVVLTPGETAAGTTANLLAPLVLNRVDDRAVQVLLAGSDLPVRAPLAA